MPNKNRRNRDNGGEITGRVRLDPLDTQAWKRMAREVTVDDDWDSLNETCVKNYARQHGRD